MLRGPHHDLNTAIVRVRVGVTVAVGVRGRGPCRDRPDCF